MKLKKILPLLLTAAILLGLLSITATAEDKRIYNIGLTIEVPQDGMDLYDGEEMQLLSVDTAYGDLFASGNVSLFSIEWDGELEGNMVFKGGFSYMATIKLAFEGGYIANYMTTPEGDTLVTSNTLQATVNGVPATVRWSAPYFPTIQVSLTVPGVEMSPEEQAAADAEKAVKEAEIRKARRATAKPYTPAEADSLYIAPLAVNVAVLDGSDKGKDGYDMGALRKYKNLSTLILDIGDEDYCNNFVKKDFPELFTHDPYIKEVWISDKTDAYEFMNRMKQSLRNVLGGGWRYWGSSVPPFFTTMGTLFVPESAVPDLIAKMREDETPPSFTVKYYTGDVYSAQKAGAAAAKDICNDHIFKTEIMTADRIYHYEDCQHDRQWFYSCAVCGKCERNPNHTFNREFFVPERRIEASEHVFLSMQATDDAYIGVNAAGDQVYWYSCVYCGMTYKYRQTHLTEKDAAGHDGTLAQLQEATNDSLAMLEQLALNASTAQPDMFTIPYKTTANVSAWAKSDVNFALNDNLLDAALLGDDYTKDITRLQFCSVAVRLAEEMTGKSIVPAAADTFADTNNEYALKAYAAGITSGISATDFAPNETLTRQQMATFLYRALQYVKNNSEYAYTRYISKLDSYADNAYIQDWAREAMAFMNALDLIKGTSDTEISPTRNCTIEQALIVAERSTYAHQIGWYQVMSEGEDENGEFTALGTANGSYETFPSGGKINTSLYYGDRVWVTGRRIGVGLDEIVVLYGLYQTAYPTINPYSGQTQYFDAKWLRPIRD